MTGAILKVLGVYGESEGDSLCRELKPDLARVMALPGKHHFGGDYQSIAEAIWKEAQP
jgi:type IV secretory pathway VirJ component